ncbi:MAG: hypothetical protein D6698_17320 [Gammaproteobacteria bacterium]|nr:MAG: hypothetical protein D6698_17320 [Gammaproteobacteria bacterium]
MKLGYFMITRDTVIKDWHLVGEMLAFIKFVPIHVSMEVASDRFIYLGFSPFFNEIEGNPVPEYDAIVVKESNGLHMTVHQTGNRRHFGLSLVEADDD